MATLVSKAEAIAFFANLDPDNITEDILTADIDDFVLNSSWTQIEDRIGFSYNIGSRTLYLNGTGERWIFVPYVPILTLTDITIKDSQETETALTLTGTSRDVWFDKEAGRIEFVTADNSAMAIFLDSDDTVGRKFTYGLENIEITGTFGPAAPGYVKYLQLIIILKSLHFKRKQTYDIDMLAEKIGNYEYKFGVPTSQSESNQYKGIDGYIEYLFSLIPNVMDIQAI